MQRPWKVQLNKDWGHPSLGICCTQSTFHDLHSRCLTRLKNLVQPTINILWYPYSLSHEKENYFFTPRVLFLSLIWLPWHFLHLVEEMGFFAPHLKQILKNSLRCCAICFLIASVIGNIFLRYPCVKAWFVPFYLYDRTNEVIAIFNYQAEWILLVIWFSIFVKVVSNFSNSNP